MSQPQGNKEILLRNRSTVKSLLNTFTSRLPPGRLRSSKTPAPTRNDSPIQPSKLILPISEGIQEELILAGCPFPVAEGISDTFLRRVRSWKSHWEDFYSEACKHTMKNIKTTRDSQQSMLNLASVVQHHHRKNIQQARQECLQEARDWVERNMQQDSEVSSRTLFNQEFVPVLERYFKINAYPSTGHRLFLAEHSKMTPRQIEVWFQNHRNRARKEGIKLNKKPDIPINFIIAPKIAPKETTPEDSEQDEDDTSEYSSDDEDSISESSITLQESSAAFGDIPPPHAFPAPYIPLQHGPFPGREEGLTFALPWYRKPAWAKQSKATAKVRQEEIDDLCGDFMIKVQGRFVNKSGKKSKKRKRRWDVHLRTIPEPAPLPSLVSQPVYEPAHPITLPKPKPAPQSQVKQAFRCCEATSTTLVPPCPGDTRDKETTRGRWITRLSARAHTLRQTPTPSRASTPSTPSTVGSPLFSPAPPSRRRRLEEDASEFESPSRKKRRTSLSSSSSRSSLSSTLTTPQLGPTGLPHVGKSQLASPPEPEFDFSSLQVDGLLGDIRPSAPLTPAELFHFGFQPPITTAKDMSFNLNLFESNLPGQPVAYAPS